MNEAWFHGGHSIVWIIHLHKGLEEIRRHQEVEIRKQNKLDNV